MKLRSLFFSFFICLYSVSAVASKQHVHPQTDNNKLKPSVEINWPGYCEIEVINRSFSNITVFGVFDDGVSMQPFNVYSFEEPSYISLYYYGYCHAGMNLYIDTFNGTHVYSGYTPTNSTVRVGIFWNQISADMHAK